MELESPADAWYVWFGVAIVSVAIAAVAIGLPSGPPPDANAAANAIERVSGSSYDASVAHDHDADEVRIDATRISMRNEHGTTHASIAFGEVVPVMGNDRLENVVYGEVVDDEFGTSQEFIGSIDAALDENGNEWRLGRSELVVRSVSWEPDDPSDTHENEQRADDRTWLDYDTDANTYYATLAIA